MTFNSRRAHRRDDFYQPFSDVDAIVDDVLTGIAARDHLAEQMRIMEDPFMREMSEDHALEMQVEADRITRDYARTLGVSIDDLNDTLY